LVVSYLYKLALHKSPDMLYVKYKTVQNTRPSHHINTMIPMYHPSVVEPGSKHLAGIVRYG
jgi:hypothetical protein